MPGTPQNLCLPWLMTSPAGGGGGQGGRAEGGKGRGGLAACLSVWICTKLHNACTHQPWPLVPLTPIGSDPIGQAAPAPALAPDQPHIQRLAGLAQPPPWGTLTDDASRLSSPAVSSCVAQAHDAAGVTQLGGLYMCAWLGGRGGGYKETGGENREHVRQEFGKSECRCVEASRGEHNTY